jgi:hypothetical protein
MAGLRAGNVILHPRAFDRTSPRRIRWFCWRCCELADDCQLVR